MGRLTIFFLAISVALIGCGTPAATPEISVGENRDVGKVAAVSHRAGDWPWWRGPAGNGIAGQSEIVPVKWSESDNVVWKANLPGRGHSSPTVVGNRIFLTTANKSQQTQSVLCLDRKTGDLVWSTEVNKGGLPPKIHNKNTHATPTVACDGNRLFASFCNHDSIQVTALDLDGNQLWQQTVGPFQPRSYKYGYAASPAIHESFVVIAADYDGGGYLAALSRGDGAIAWRKSRPAKLSYSSPVITNIAGRDQLLISGCDLVAGIDPNTGDEIWSIPATTMATCGSLVWDGDLVFASGGYPKAETVCVRADGKGEILWRNRTKCYEQSMLAHDGFVYAVDDGGIAYCWKADDGTQKWRHRLSGPISSSPVLAGGNIYLTNERGTTFVFKADPENFESVAENRLGEEGFATLSICSGQIFIRTTIGRGQGTLYCIGRNGEANP